MCTLGTVENELDKSVEDGLWRTRQRIEAVITSEDWYFRKMSDAKGYIAVSNKGLFLFSKGSKLSSLQKGNG